MRRRIDWFLLLLATIPIVVYIIVQAVTASSPTIDWLYYGTFTEVADDPVSWLLFVLAPTASCISIVAIR